MAGLKFRPEIEIFHASDVGRRRLWSEDPQAWLADVLARIPDYKITKADELLPWRWSR